jgi:TP901 family phage tail tape measure protein
MGFLGVMRSITAAVSSFLPIAGTLAPVLAVGLAAASAVQLEDALSDVAIAFNVMGKDGEEVLASLEAKAKEMGRTTRFTAKQSALALRELGLGGLSASQSMTVLNDVLDLGAANNLQLAESAKLVVDSMIKYGLAANDTGQIVDQLTGFQTRVQGTAVDLGAAHRTLGSIASALGVSFTEASIALAGLIKSGETGEAAGTALGFSLQKLVTPTAEASRALKRLGIDIDQFIDPATGRIGNLIVLFEALADAGITGKDVFEIFGARGRKIAGIFNLIQRDSAGLTDAWQKVKGLADDVGIAGEAAAFKMQRGWGPLIKLWSAIVGLFIELGEVLKPLVDGMTVLTNSAVDLTSRLGADIFAEFTSQAEGVEGIMRSIASAMDAITPENMKENLRELGDLAIETFNAVGETIFDILVKVFKRLAQEARAIFFDIAADIAKATQKQRAEQINQAFGKFGTVVPLGLQDEARVAAIEAAKAFGSEQEASFRRQAELAREAAAGLTLFGEGGIGEDFNTLADRLDGVADKFVVATAPGRLDSFRNRMTEAAESISKAVSDEIDIGIDPARMDKLNDAVESVRETLGLIEQAAKGDITAGMLRTLDEITEKIAKDIKVALDFQVPTESEKKKFGERDPDR